MKGNPQVEAGHTWRYGASEESACGSFCVQIMRVILIVSCALGLIGYIVYFYELCHILSLNITSLFGYDLRIFGLIPICIGFAGYLVGLVGAYRNHPTALRNVSANLMITFYLSETRKLTLLKQTLFCSIQFSIWLAIMVVLLSLNSLMMRFNYTANRTEFDGYLKKYGEEYVWSRNHEVETKNEANLVWDTLQTKLVCCGLDSYHFWDQYRPPSLQPNEYPSSCCLHYNQDSICLSGDNSQHSRLRRVSCGERLTELKAMMGKFILGGQISASVLCIMAFLVSRSAARRRALLAYST